MSSVPLQVSKLSFFIDNLSSSGTIYINKKNSAKSEHYGIVSFCKPNMSVVLAFLVSSPSKCYLTDSTPAAISALSEEQ